MKRKLASLLFLLCVFLNGFTQQTGKVEYKELGLTFIIPPGWTGQEGEGAYVMNSAGTPGMILLLPHDHVYDQSQMLQEARGGLTVNQGTYLMPRGTVSPYGSNAIRGDFEGLVEYETVLAHVIALTNPHGNGITIIALAHSSEYQPGIYQSLANDVKESVIFTPVEAVSTPSNSSNASTSTEDWKHQLGGTLLTYMESYNSGGMNGGGYNMETKIHLCKAGYFRYSDKSFLSAGNESVSGYSTGSNKGDGQWDIREQQGKALLYLNFHGGQQKTFTLEWKDNGKLHLNGYRYFRTWEGEYAPDCD